MELSIDWHFSVGWHVRRDEIWFLFQPASWAELTTALLMAAIEIQCLSWSVEKRREERRWNGAQETGKQAALKKLSPLSVLLFFPSVFAHELLRFQWRRGWHALIWDVNQYLHEHWRFDTEAIFEDTRLVYSAIVINILLYSLNLLLQQEHLKLWTFAKRVVLCMQRQFLNASDNRCQFWVRTRDFYIQ